MLAAKAAEKAALKQELMELTAGAGKTVDKLAAEVRRLVLLENQYLPKTTPGTLESTALAESEQARKRERERGSERNRDEHYVPRVTAPLPALNLSFRGSCEVTEAPPQYTGLSPDSREFGAVCYLRHARS